MPHGHQPLGVPDPAPAAIVTPGKHLCQPGHYGLPMGEREPVSRLRDQGQAAIGKRRRPKKRTLTTRVLCRGKITG